MEGTIADFNHLFLGFVANLIVKPFSISAAMAIIAMLFLLIISALVSAAEAAFFALSPADLASLKNSELKADKKVVELISKPKRLLATLLISVNFVNIAIVILSTFLIELLFDFSASPLLGFIIQVIAVTFLILLVAETIPKIFGTQLPLITSRYMSYPTFVLKKVFYPLSSFLIFSTSIIDKRVKHRGVKISVDELSHALELTSDTNLPHDDRKILKGIVKFGNTDAKEIMKARLDVMAFDYNLKYKELIGLILNSGFSRVPIFKENLDNVVGVLYIKDLLAHLNEEDSFSWQTLIRPPFFVPENKKIDDLLKEFQHKKVHLAIVVDEYGGTSGIVTLEDIIEEIVGEIQDEFDDEDIVYSKLDNNNYVFEGKAMLNDLTRVLELDESFFEREKGDSNTLAGFLIEKEERIPKKNEIIQFKHIEFKIESADTRKIKRVKVTIFEKNEQGTGEEKLESK